MTHALEIVVMLAVLWAMYRFATHEMNERDKLSDAEKAARQEDEAW